MHSPVAPTPKLPRRWAGVLRTRAACLRQAYGLLALAAVATLGATTLAADTSAAAEPPPYWVIVHPGTALEALERRYLGDVFLKKTTRWPNGDPIFPVDLEPDSRVRRRFSDEIIGRTVSSVKTYWQQIIFSGRGLPPPELAGDDAVVAYVLTHPGAIGYVSGTADIGRARAIAVR